MTLISSNNLLFDAAVISGVLHNRNAGAVVWVPHAQMINLLSVNWISALDSLIGINTANQYFLTKPRSLGTYTASNSNAYYGVTNNVVPEALERFFPLSNAFSPILVSIVNGVVTSTTGVVSTSVVLDNSDPLHIQVTVDLGTTTKGKRRKPRCLRLFPNGEERDIRASMNRKGEAYIFTFLKTHDGSNSVNLILT